MKLAALGSLSTVVSGEDLPQAVAEQTGLVLIDVSVPFYRDLFGWAFQFFLVTTLKRIDLHPMNYFFLAAAFFAFHLLLAYLADHVSIHAAFLVSSPALEQPGGSHIGLASPVRIYYATLLKPCKLNPL